MQLNFMGVNNGEQDCSSIYMTVLCCAVTYGKKTTNTIMNIV